MVYTFERSRLLDSGNREVGSLAVLDSGATILVDEGPVGCAKIVKNLVSQPYTSARVC